MLKYFKVNDEAVASGSRLDLTLKRIPCLERDKSLIHGVKAAVIMIMIQHQYLSRIQLAQRQTAHR
jgi:hypothetical protein